MPKKMLKAAGIEVFKLYDALPNMMWCNVRLEIKRTWVLLHVCCIIVTRWGEPGKIEA